MAISGRHPRSVPAAVKTVLAPRFVIARREATWQSQVGTAVRNEPSKNGMHLRFVIARSEATWQSREGTAVRNEPPLNRHAPPICHCEERSDVAISGRHCRSERATVKPACTPDLSLRGAKRRGNLGKALPFSTSHRKTACTPDLSLRGGRRPTWQSREGTPDPYRPPLKQCWPPDLSLRGAKRRGNLGKAPPIRTGRR